MICTICDGEFDPETEGGDAGFIGMLPVAFCPTCKVGIFTYVEQRCELCSTFEESSENSAKPDVF